MIRRRRQAACEVLLDEDEEHHSSTEHREIRSRRQELLRITWVSDSVAGHSLLEAFQALNFWCIS